MDICCSEANGKYCCCLMLAKLFLILLSHMLYSYKTMITWRHEYQCYICLNQGSDFFQIDAEKA